MNAQKKHNSAILRFRAVSRFIFALFRAHSQRESGFTILELLVVFVIIIILSIYTISGYSQSYSRLAVERSIEQFISDAYGAKEKSLSYLAYKEEGSEDIYKHDYGIYIQEEASEYIIFLDKNNDKKYSSGEAIEIIETDKKVKISNISVTDENNSLSILFSHDRKVYFNNEEAGEGAPNSAEITFSVINSEDNEKKIIVNKQGVVQLDI